MVPQGTDSDLLVVTNEGFAKRTALSEYRLQGRNGYGVKAINLVEGRGNLIGAIVVAEDDQVMAIMKSGKVIRSDVSEIKRTGRNTQGVTLAKPDKGDEIISVARNAETEDQDEPSGSESGSENSRSLNSDGSNGSDDGILKSQEPVEQVENKAGESSAE